MSKLKYLYFIIIGSLLITSCNKQINEKQVDPNNPASVPPRLLLGTILTDLSGTGTAGRLSATGSSEGINAWDGAHRWNQYHCSNYDYYDNNVYSWSDGSFNAYLVLKNVVQMENEGARISLPAINPYESVGKFVRAYYYYNMTSMFGDIPLGKDLQGLQNLSPAYTSQEKVFEYVLNVLDTANDHFAALIAANDVKNTLNADQDIYYGGKLEKWQKLVNAFKLRVLISLSSKASDAALNVPAQFANIISNPSKYPLFTGPEDDLQFLYNPGGTNTYSLYPFNPSNFGSVATRFNMARTYIAACTGIKDPRVFVTSEPAWALVGNDTDPAQFQYFAGASTGESLKSMYNNANVGKYSFINRKRYYSDFTGEPHVLVGYKEMCFNIAEAITRGWVSGDAETWYKAGITTSMAFYGIDVSQPGFTAYFLPPTGSSTSDVKPYPVTFNFNTYYADPAVQLSATPATAINQIVLQKYIAFFENSGYEAYFNWRRTGVPAFDGGVGVGNNGTVPVRWAYPVSEQTVNTANHTAALTSQGFGADDLNQKMWLIK